MSIVVIIGVIFAIAIAGILGHLLITAVNRWWGPLDSFWVALIWAVVAIFCIFMIAYAFEIPIPFFRWR